MDDIILTGTSLDAIQAINNALLAQFTIKDLGPLKYFLGLEMARFVTTTVLS